MALSNKLFAITLFAPDLAATEAFYRAVFEREPIANDKNSVLFQFGETYINLLAASQAPSLLTPAAVATASTANRSLLTVQVENVDDEAVRLAEIGVDINNGPLDQPWGIRAIQFADPTGQMWEFSHNLPA